MNWKKASAVIRKRMFCISLALGIAVAGIPVEKAQAAEHANVISSGTGWSIDTEYKLVIESDAGISGWMEYKKNSSYNAGMVNVVEVSEGVTSIAERAFFNCGKLTAITIPESVTNIGEYAFYSCYKLKSITIPRNVEHIGRYAFGGCTGMTDILVEEENTAYYSQDNAMVIEADSGILIAGAGGIKEGIHIPNGVKVISEGAFQGTQFVSASIPSSVTRIEKGAFSSCNALTHIDIAEGLEKIEDEAFQRSSLTEITLPASIASIGNSVFEQCSKLTSINVKESNLFYYSRNDLLIEKASHTVLACAGGKNETITVPNGVKYIGDGAFASANLTGITIPGSVESIGENAFGSCYGLEKVTLAEGTKVIKDRAFWWCDRLTDISIPASVKSIGNGVFEDCNYEKLTIHCVEGSYAHTFAVANGIAWKQLAENGTEPEAPAEPRVFTVTFHANGGTNLSQSSSNIKEGAAINALPTVKRTGYTFQGWYTAKTGGTKVTANTKITKSQALYAQWKINTYTVKFHANGGKNVSRTSIKVKYNSKAGKLPAAERLGYTLKGWYTKKSGGAKLSSATRITKSQTVYAQWKKAGTYTVKFNKNGGTKLSNTSLKVTKNQAIAKLPTVQRKGYTLKGWYTKKSGGSKVTASTKIKKNQTLYAQWSKVTRPGKPGAPSLKNSSSGQLAVSIKKVSGAKGYQIAYSTSRKFTKSTTKYITTSERKQTVKKLKKGKTYYVRIRAYKMDSAGNKIYGSYGNTKQIKIK